MTEELTGNNLGRLIENFLQNSQEAPKAEGAEKPFVPGHASPEVEPSFVPRSQHEGSSYLPSKEVMELMQTAPAGQKPVSQMSNEEVSEFLDKYKAEHPYTPPKIMDEPGVVSSGFDKRAPEIQGVDMSSRGSRGGMVLGGF